MLNRMYFSDAVPCLLIQWKQESELEKMANVHTVAANTNVAKVFRESD